MEGTPICPVDDPEAAEECFAGLGEGPQIHGPWRFEFDVPGR
jgi:hypothetical protein